MIARWREGMLKSGVELFVGEGWDGIRRELGNSAVSYR